MARILFFSERDILARFLGENCQLVWDTSGMKKLKKKKDTLVGKVSILQPERGIRIKWIIFRADSSNLKSEQKFEVETP